MNEERATGLLALNPFIDGGVMCGMVSSLVYGMIVADRVIVQPWRYSIYDGVICEVLSLAGM